MTPVITSNEQVIEQTTDVLALHQSLASCSNGWVDITTEPVNVIHMCKFSDVSTPSTQRPPVITHSLSVNANLTWTLHIHGHPVSPQSCTVLQSVPGTLTSESLHALLQLVDDSKVCCGQPDSHFVSMVKGKKGKIISVGGQVKAYIDEHAPTTLGDDCYQATIRMTSCELLTRGTKCSKCKSYRGTLRAMHNRWVKRNACDMSSPTSHSNERYLNTPQRKQKMSKLKKRLVMAERQVNKLAAKIEEFTQTQGTSVDPGLHSGLLSVMNDSTETVNKTFAEGTFARLFWEQQLKVASVKDCRQARWHPLMIKFCLNIKLMSSAAYHALRTSGFIRLPSERTLRDYTHFFKSSPGIHSDLNEQLKKEAAIESLPESQRYVALLIDEMKIKEDLVYDKYSGHIIGFTSLGDLNDIMSCLEQGCEEEVLHPSLSKYILVLMVRGIFFRLEFPYAHFGTEGATGDFLFPIIWDAIRQLECIGLKVICVTGDGASPNRKFFRMHGEKGAITYKTHNPFADPKENRPLFFVSDPPHLVKTTRNCWSHSGYNGTRLMSVSFAFLT
ncbi:hypothetical protein SPONN_126 [uncultured Candidatus Thioglobus sp.]|nr:hypothetical protein SPONN_126 [uncultured Candidatus Thioglobus sp.]